MSRFAEPMVRLIEELKKLPGIGSKTAQRLAFYILRSNDEDAEALAAAVRDVKASLRLCSVCNNITDVDPCVYCTSPTRNQRIVCVVEEPTNIAAIEKSKHFNGVYHVLHGTISPLHGVGPEQLRISNLARRVDGGQVEEVIIATNPTVEGEATAVYLSEQLKRPGLKVTEGTTGSLGRGARWPVMSAPIVVVSRDGERRRDWSHELARDGQHVIGCAARDCPLLRGEGCDVLGRAAAAVYDESIDATRVRSVFLPALELLPKGPGANFRITLKRAADPALRK